ncbi:MAG: phosphoenolpyruvate synthase [Lentisphaerae bacterium]|nr:phosphoenolpyruvate synthase [Lentisphaerota bacterium]
MAVNGPRRLLFVPGEGAALRAGGATALRSIGGKAANLARLQAMGQPVPPWFAVTTDAFRLALDEGGLAPRVDEILGALRDPAGVSAASRALREAIGGAPFPARLRAELASALGALAGPDDFLAVRSSAADEDGAGQSFAGLHDSFLFVRGEEAVREAVRGVWASAFNERALAYRLERGLPLTGIRVAAVAQRMIDAAVSGVMFTADPVSGDALRIVISAVYGAGEGLVSAGLDADTFTLGKDTFKAVSQTAHKSEQMVFDRAAGRGLRRVAVPPERRDLPALDAAQLRAVAEAGLAIERGYGRPQDIEFCLDAGGRLHILQARPVTTAVEYGPAAGNHLIWDNSNIIESYSGVTTPMTFSFIRRAYATVYHCFAQVMGIPARAVRANEAVFENMLGLFRGQVYYNLLNWYRLVRLFPGFQYNKEFMESMMGVKEPVELRGETQTPTRFRRWFVELPLLLRLVLRSARHFLRIRSLAAAFQSNFETHYRRWEAMDFDALQPHELMAVYREMETRLLWNWRAPIVNDFYVMIFYGTLKKLCAKWCGDDKGSLQNDLICGEGGIESTEPTRRLLRLARAAQQDPELQRLIRDEAGGQAHATVMGEPRFAAFAEEVREYLARYGFRCMNELKLEEYSLQERPAFLYAVLRNYLAIDRPEALDTEAIDRREARIRREAEARAFAAARRGPGGPLRLLLFRRVLRNARLGVKNRENMRFARTRIYGLLRRLLRALGRRLAAEGLVPEADDVFYLTLDECWDFVKGTAVTADLTGLAALRRREFERYRAETESQPDDRFDTYGMAYHRNRFRRREPAAPAPADGKLRGIGCCPGEVEQVVKVLRVPGDDMRLAGEILVAERTDPGWVPLYPSVSGVLIERGSILSHSAIVAREMGIPTIVGIPGLTAALKTGRRVRMDGAAGTVELLDTCVVSSRSVQNVNSIPTDGG